MHLTPSFDPQLIKREKLQHFKGLIASIKNNHALVEQFFTVCFQEIKTLSIILFILEILSKMNRYLQENILQPQ